MNKREMVAFMRLQMGPAAKNSIQIGRTIDAVLDLIAARLERGQSTYIKDLCVFAPVFWSARTLINPYRNWEYVKVSARYRVRFYPSQAIQEAVN